MDEWSRQDWKDALDDRGSKRENEAYRRLGKILHPAALAMAYRLHGSPSRLERSHAPEDFAKDLVNQTLLKVFESYPRFRWDSHITTYAYKILNNEVEMFFRRAENKRAVRADFLEPNSDDPAAFTFADMAIYTLALSRETNGDVHTSATELEQHILAAVDSLSETLRQVLVMHYDGYSVAEIQKHLDISTDATHKNLSRARNKIRHYLIKRGIGLDPTATRGSR